MMISVDISIYSDSRLISLTSLSNGVNSSMTTLSSKWDNGKLLSIYAGCGSTKKGNCVISL